MGALVTPEKRGEWAEKIWNRLVAPKARNGGVLMERRLGPAAKNGGISQIEALLLAFEDEVREEDAKIAEGTRQPGVSGYGGAQWIAAAIRRAREKGGE